MKRLFLFIMLFTFFGGKCFSSDLNSKIFSEVEEQLVQSNANKIKECIPDYAKNLLNEINAFDLSKIGSVNLYEILNIFIKKIIKQMNSPLKNSIFIILVLSISSIVSSFYKNQIIEFIILAFICINTSKGISDVLKISILSLNLSSKFISCFIPVFTTFVISLGKPFSAQIFNMSLLYCNKIIIDIVDNFMFPLTNFMSGLCILSSLSSKLKLKKIFDIFYVLIKWVLITFSSFVLFAFSINKILSSSIDNTLVKELKFAMGLVPIIGSAINDASSVVKASAKILEVNIGVFGILSILFIFLPSIVECCLWIFSFQICELVSEMFDFGNLNNLFSSFKKIIGIILSFIVICFLIFMFSTSSMMKNNL